jgi:hypothetical protein
MDPKKEVLERLLLAKHLLGKARRHPVAEPDRFFLAEQIISAHDASELALAAICAHCGTAPAREKQYLMNYLDSLRELHPGREVSGREYFRQLNQARIGIKHYGILPDPKQWARTAETVYDYLSEWSGSYLGVSLDDLDESGLLRSPRVVAKYEAAKAAAEGQGYREAFERLAEGLQILFAENPALRGLQVGRPNPEDAIRLTGFGVHANDFLALQEFLPEVVNGFLGVGVVRWKQSKFGHPGNWREDAVGFCLRVFLDVALKIQHAEWIPGAIEFSVLYEYNITALRDGVEVWREAPEPHEAGRATSMMGALERLVGKTRREVVRILKGGESLRAQSVSFPGPRLPTPILPLMGLTGTGKEEARRGPGPQKAAPVPDAVLELWGVPLLDALTYVSMGDVNVTCVPRDDDFVKKHFPGLPETDWHPS